MSLNIKNERTHQLVRELSRLTGKTQTSVVEMAVQHYLEHMYQSPPTGMAERLLAIGKDTAPRLHKPYKSIDHGDLLYGEDGLPR